MTAPLISYYRTTDTPLVQLRPWPESGAVEDLALVGREDAGKDVVIRYGPDGEPFAWEIDCASQHPDRIAEALKARRQAMLGPRSTCVQMEPSERRKLI